MAGKSGALNLFARQSYKEVRSLIIKIGRQAQYKNYYCKGACNDNLFSSASFYLYFKRFRNIVFLSSIPFLTVIVFCSVKKPLKVSQQFLETKQSRRSVWRSIKRCRSISFSRNKEAETKTVTELNKVWKGGKLMQLWRRK